MWDGGSLAFWNEILQPEKIVGADLNPRKDSPYFRDHVRARGLEAKVKSYWGTNQADGRALLRIIDQEFGSELDMVIDDASHPSRAFKPCFHYCPPAAFTSSRIRLGSTGRISIHPYIAGRGTGRLHHWCMS
jgi:hypothetical protein